MNLKGRSAIIFIFFAVLFLPHDLVQASVVNPKQVYSFEQMERDIKKLAEQYPDLIEYEIIGYSEFDRPIYAVALGNGLSTSYINASNHAREWISTNLTMYMIDQYAKAYQDRRSIGSYDVKALLDQHRIWFVPMMNPDGVMIQQQGLKAVPASDQAAVIQMNNGSLNFSRWKANGKGVDLNRQFDANWSRIANSPGKPSYAMYKGKSPHSASEVKAVLSLTERIKPEMAVSYHSSGSILFWNFHQKGAQLTRDRALARSIGQMTGYRLMGVPTSTGGGGYTDWFIQTHKKPAFTPELGTYVGATHVPLSQFDRIWNENRLIGLFVGRESHKLYEERLRKTVNPVALEINGKAVPSTNSFIVEQRTVVPLRSIFEQLGATVSWDETKREVVIQSSDVMVRLPVHKKHAFMNGEKVALDVPALLLDGRTYVPVRFIVEAIGAQVDWLPSERKVRIIYQPDLTSNTVEVVEEMVEDSSDLDMVEPSNEEGIEEDQEEYTQLDSDE